MRFMDRNRKIVIVYVIDFIASTEGLTGGTERQLIELLRHLDETKFRPILICLQEFGLVPQWEELNCEKHVINVYSLSSFKALLSLISFVRFLRKNSVNIVQTFFFDSTLFAVVGARLAGIRNVVSCRRDAGFWIDKKISRINRILNFFIKRFLVNCEAIKTSLVGREKISEASVDVIYNGIDIQSIDEVRPADLSLEFKEIEKRDFVVGLVANFNREVKRVDIFVKAAAEVTLKFKNVKFLIIGGGQFENDLKKLARKLAVEDIVIFGGKKNTAIQYVKSFDIGVLTSDSEGFSNVILEYMASGLPVIATDVGGNRELIENENIGTLVSPGDYKAIAKEICRLLSEKPRRIMMGKMARHKIKEKYSWNKKIREIETYYNNILDNS